MHKLIPLSARSLSFVALTQANQGKGNSCDIAFIDGTIEKKTLFAAVDQVARAHPILQSKILRKWPHYYWQFDAERLPEKQYLDWTDRFDNQQQWQQAIRELLSEQCVDPFQGSPVQFFCITFKDGSQPKSTLVFLSAHIASDARSGFVLFEQLQRSLTGQPLDRSDTGPAKDTLRFSPLKWADWFRASQVLLSDLFSRSKNYGYEQDQQWQFCYRDLGSEALKNAQQWARQQGCTAHVAINWGLNLALNQAQSSPDHNAYRIYETLSVRPFANTKLNHHYDNLIMPFSTDIGGQADWHADYGKTVKRMLKQDLSVYRAKLEIEALSIRLLPRIALPALVKSYKAGFMVGNVLVSNLGKRTFSGDDIGGCKLIDIYNYSVPFQPAGLAFVISQYQGRLRYSLATRGATPNELVDAIENVFSGPHLGFD